MLSSFVHGGGDPDQPLGSRQLSNWLAAQLRGRFEVHAPVMPEPDEPRYGPWRDAIVRELQAFGEPAVLVGHSFGGSVLVKHLTEGAAVAPPRGLFLVDAPFWGPGGWEYDEFDLPPAWADRLPRIPTFLYHSREDPEVEFSHLALYAAGLPHATVRELEGADHSYTEGLPELAFDIQSLR